MISVHELDQGFRAAIIATCQFLLTFHDLLLPLAFLFLFFLFSGGFSVGLHFFLGIEPLL